MHLSVVPPLQNPKTFKVLIAPVDILVDALNSNLNAALQDSLHQRQLLPHPHSAGSPLHLSGGAPRFHIHTALCACVRPHLQKMTELADRVFCIYEGEKAPVKGRAKMPGDQATLEAYS